MKIIFSLILIITSVLSFGQSNILSEDFENGIPSTWTTYNLDGKQTDTSVAEYVKAWITVADPYDTTNTNKCASATSFFVYPGSANRWLITPKLTFGEHGNMLTYRAASFDPSFPDNYAIKIGTDINRLDQFETIVTVLQEAPEWSTHTFTFDTLGYNNQDVYIAFVLISDDGHKLYLDDIKVDVNVNVSTSNIEASNFSIYPNPTSDFLHVLNANEDDKRIEKRIYDMTGKVVLTTTADKIQISDLENGIYFIDIKGNKLMKFVKE